MTRISHFASVRSSQWGWVFAAWIAGCGAESTQAPSDATDDADASTASTLAARALVRSSEAVIQRLEAPTVDIRGVQCARRSDGPPYSCLQCVVNGPCDTGVPCRVGRTTACINDRPTCVDIGPAPNGSECGAMGSGRVCTSGVCTCPAGQQDCNGICRAAGTCVAGVGACAVTGTWVCSGTNAVCSATPAPPQPETCNGIDDNCNGVIDDVPSVACNPTPCQTGMTYCMGGATACARTGHLPAGTACTGLVGGVCDGSGNCVCPAGQSNCAGTCRPTGAFCSVGVGACTRTGTIICSGAGTACSATAGAPSTEVCNGVDDNCDGMIDNLPTTACSPNPCQTGVLACSGASTVCVATANRPAGTSCNPPSAGVCNGTGSCVCPAGTSLCSGVCTAGVGNACTVGVGVCQRTGTLVCTGAGTSACNVSPGPPAQAAETLCTNGLDDDCDGLTDWADPDCVPPPANDRCTSATVVDLGPPGNVVTLTGNTSTANHDTDGSCGASTTAPDVFYRFTLTQRSIVYADAFGSSYDIVLFFTGGCAATQTAGYACNDDACGTLQSQLSQVLNPGTYFLVVSGFSGARGAFSIRMQNLPASDRVFTLSPGISTISGNTSGLADRHTPGCATSSSPDETWFYTTCPSFGGGSMYAETCSRASWDTMLTFRQGNAGSVLCNDDACGLQSRISGGVTGGAAIRALYVDGWSSNSGPYSVYVEVP